MKRSILLLIAAILGLAYLIYIITYFSGIIANSSSGTELIAGGIATALVMPHIICVGVAVIFNVIGWALKARWAALVAGILYAVSMACMFMYAVFVVIQMILCFIGFAKMKQNVKIPAQQFKYFKTESERTTKED